MNTDIEHIHEPYYVIEKANCREVITEVTRFIQAGWKPIGGIAAFVNGGRVLFLQAVVR